MKKFVLSSILFLLMGTCGSAIVGIGTAQAQTVSPADAAMLNQSLEVIKAKLLNLQAEVDAQATGAAPVSEAMGVGSVSAQDIAVVSSGLQSLTAALSQLSQAIIATNGNLTPGNRIALQSILSGATATLIAMNQTLAGGSSPAPIAATQPAGVVQGKTLSLAPPAVQLAPAVAPPANTNGGSVVAPSEPQQAVGAAPTGFVTDQPLIPVTAQIGDKFPLTNGWMLAIGIIILILIIFWAWKSRSGRKADRIVESQVSAAVSSGTKPVVPLIALPQHPENHSSTSEHVHPHPHSPSVAVPPKNGNS